MVNPLALRHCPPALYFVLSAWALMPYACFVYAAPPASPLDQLDSRSIPDKRRYEGQPKELVAVVGEHREQKGESNRYLTFSPDGKTLAVLAPQSVVELYDLDGPSFKKRTEFTQLGWGDTLSFTPDGKTLITGGNVALWDVGGAQAKKRTVLKMLVAPHARYLALAPDGKTLAFGNDESLRVWSLAGAEPRERAVLKGHAGYCIRVVFSRDGKLLASGGRDDVVRIWDMTGPEPRERAVVRTLGVTGGIDFAPDGKILATGIGRAADLTVRLWDLTQAEPKESAVLKGHKSGLCAVQFMGDGQLLAALTGSGQLLVWDVASGKLRHDWQLPGKAHCALVAAPDGRHIGVAQLNGIVYVLRLAIPSHETKE